MIVDDKQNLVSRNPKIFRTNKFFTNRIKILTLQKEKKPYEKQNHGDFFEDKILSFTLTIYLFVIETHFC